MPLPTASAALRITLQLCLLLLVRCQEGPWNTVLTYNVGLPGKTGLTPFYEERRAPLLNLINAGDSPFADADVVCLQEVIKQEDRVDVLARAKEAGFAYGFAGTLEDGEQGGPACNDSLLQAAVCLNTSCPSATSVLEALPCILGECKLAVSRLSQPCHNCLAQQEDGLEAAVIACRVAPAKNYSSSLGLMLLSRREILHEQLVPFGADADPFRRGYIRADVQQVGTIFCTHAYPNFEELPMFKNDYEMMNRKQMMALVDAASGHNSIIAGDMNCGPANSLAKPPVMPLFPASYEYAGSQGFTSPYADGDNSQCTFCADNSINLAAATVLNRTGMDSTILDHIFINPQVFKVDATQTKRVFADSTVRINGGLTVPLSDHYGIQVRVASSASPLWSASALLWSLAAVASLAQLAC